MMYKYVHRFNVVGEYGGTIVRRRNVAGCSSGGLRSMEFG